MQLILHGYCRGTSLSGLEDLRAAAAVDTPALEFDVCRSKYTGRLVLAHGAATVDAACLSLDDALAYLRPTAKTAFVELKEPDLAEEAIERIVGLGMADRVVVFGFSRIARSFPWRDRAHVQLGIVSMFPWHIERDIARFRPDSVVIGWGSDWERYTFHLEKFLFRIGWHVFRLPDLVRRHRGVKFVVATLRSRNELRWLGRYDDALYGTLVDRSFFEP